MRDPDARWRAERWLLGEEEEDDEDFDADDEGDDVDEQEEFDEEPTDEGPSPARAAALDRDERLTLDLADLDWPATLEQLKGARRKLAALYHPDRHHDSEALMKLMQRWNGACDRLEKRIAGA